MYTVHYYILLVIKTIEQYNRKPKKIPDPTKPAPASPTDQLPLPRLLLFPSLSSNLTRMRPLKECNYVQEQEN